jgi:hypothetical protein
VEKLREAGGRWPALPPPVLVLLRPDGVEVVQERGVGPPEEVDTVSAVKQRAEQLHQELRGRFAFVAGVAFAHQ